jgi:hypothetical protein
MISMPLLQAGILCGIEKWCDGLWFELSKIRRLNRFQGYNLPQNNGLNTFF